MIFEDKILKRISELENSQFNIIELNYRLEELKWVISLIENEYDDCK